MNLTLAMVKKHYPPDEHLLRISHNVLYACKYGDDASLEVIDAAAITAVVIVAPFSRAPCERDLPSERLEGRHWIAEPMGVDLRAMQGVVEPEE